MTTPDRPKFTPRNVAKFVVKAVVAQKTAQFTKAAIADYTSMNTDTTTVGVSCQVVGWYVSDKLKPITDAAVDKTADFLVAKNNDRKAAKQDKTEKKD
jgi:hypothetical protein